MKRARVANRPKMLLELLTPFPDLHCKGTWLSLQRDEPVPARSQ
jgi:hypothetical protein